jgi:CxxC motif-containing protein
MMEQKEYTCIVCPKSCRGILRIQNGYFETEGFSCKNGEEYAISEYQDPKRVLTTTVWLRHGLFRLLPVVSRAGISRKVFKSCLEELYTIEVEAPIEVGDVVVKNILNTGIDVIAARSIERDG